MKIKSCSIKQRYKHCKGMTKSKGRGTVLELDIPQPNRTSIQYSSEGEVTTHLYKRPLINIVAVVLKLQYFLLNFLVNLDSWDAMILLNPS